MSIEQIKSHLRDYVDEISAHSRKGDREGYICPLCGSGKGKNKTGAFLFQKMALDGNASHAINLGTFLI